MADNRIKMFSQGVKTSINRHSLKKSEWICENFSHPKNDRLPWSFEDHEYQVDIVDETASDIVVMKAAQTGMSELSIRASLAFCAMSDFLKMAYCLPTAKFSSEFSATRFDPAIDSSPYVSSVMSKDVDNTSVKKIGTSFILLKGTSGATSAISIDLDYILVDEHCFCNQEILGKFASRLQHSDLKLTTNFSTPTVPDYSIASLFDASSQGQYRVKHSRCEQWVAPSFYTDVIIPGFDEAISEYRKEDSFHPGVKKAFVSCPHCSHEIAWSDFCDPSRREWIHKFPDRDRAGYHVLPWDLPKYNPLVDVLQSVDKFNSHGDWVNFRLGLPHASSENSFIKEVIERNTSGKGETLDSVVNSGYGRVFMGVDLGKTSWITVGVATSSGLRVVCACSVKVADLPEQNLGKYILTLFRALRGQRVIVDAMPNFETAMFLSNKLYQGMSYGAYYGGQKKNMLDIYSFNDKEGVVSIDRDASFDALAKAVNSGVITFAEPTEYTLDKDKNKISTLLTHLMNMKKIQKSTSKGMIASWEKTGEDHLSHCLNYMYTAYSSVEERFSGSVVSAGLKMSSVTLKG